MDPRDELTSVDDGSQKIDYSYDGLGRRSVRTEGVAAQTAHYGDLSDRPILDTDGEEKALTSYLRGPGGLIEQRSSGATSYPLADAHGDIATMTKATGEVESRQTYDPWGSQLSGPSLEMGYLGAQERRSDPAAGLIQMGQRPYDPALGAFASEDPVIGHLGSAVSFDRYPYAWDNPLNRYDLDGRDVCVPTPFGDACAEDAAEGVTGAGEKVGEVGTEVGSTAWNAGGEVAGAAGSGIDTAWDWTAPGRSWVGDRAQGFWKALPSALSGIYHFAGSNWEYCRNGALAGASDGAVVGTLVGPEGTAAGGYAGGAAGCVGTVVVATVIRALYG